MPTEKEVYDKYADEYDRLIQREDYQGNILSEIKKTRFARGFRRGRPWRRNRAADTSSCPPRSQH